MFESLAVGIYEVAAGLGIVGWWMLERGKKARTSLEAGDWSHLAAEILAAAALVSTGVWAVVEGPGWRGPSLLGLGMLLYATVNAAGAMKERSRLTAWAMAMEAAATAVFISLLLSVA